MWILGSSPDKQVRFILDSTACPQLISLVQVFGQEIQNRVCYLTRTWAFSIHRHKLKLLGRWPENVKTNNKKTRPCKDLVTNHYFTPLPTSPSINFENDLTINLITNVNLFPALMTLPQRSTTLLPAATTPLPAGAGCATPYPCSSIISSPASTRAIPYNVESVVPSVTTVQSDQPPDAMPGPSCITVSNLSPSVNCVVGLDKNLTGHGSGHRVMDCSPSSAAGHQQPESPIMSVSLSVTPIVRTVARAASLS